MSILPRASDEVFASVLNKAQSDYRIRAVLLNGSRANPNVIPDDLQDYDIVYVVEELESFISDHRWINYFGEVLILQLPDEMTADNENEISKNVFHYLMLFKDRVRIDLTLVKADKFKEDLQSDSLTKVLLDKDNLFANISEPGEQDYLIKKPDQKEFAYCCNEFWWVSTYVAKGLCRNEITYAKDMLEKPVRDMFMKMIEWYIGMKTDFTVSFGKSGKNMKNYISAEVYENILQTYPDYKIENIWKSLFLMINIFSNMAKEVSVNFGLNYNQEEEVNVIEYLNNV